MRSSLVFSALLLAAPASAQWTNLFNAKAGTNGLPRLVATGPHVGHTIEFRVSNALPLTPAFFVIGFSRVNLPVLGGRLVPNPDIFLFGPTDRGGRATFRLPLPKDIGIKGLRIWAQGLIVDPKATQGMAFSNALFGIVTTAKPSFAAPVKRMTIDGPVRALAAGRINAGLNPDFVGTDTNNDRIRIRYGSGGGAFPGVHVWTMGDWPSDVELADFNRDGKTDLITTNYMDNKIRIRWGHSSFRTYSTYTVGTRPWQVAVGDLNKDGYDDFVTTNLGNPGGDSLTVRLRKPAGGFTSVTYASGDEARDVQLADFNGDGHLDIVYPVGRGIGARIMVRRNDGAGRFNVVFVKAVPNPGTHFFHSLTHGDYNRDGKVDVVASCGNGDLVLLRGLGNGTFHAPIRSAIEKWGHRVYTTDINCDSIDDLVVATLGEGVLIYLGKGDGNMVGPTKLKTTSTSWVYDVATADFNRDGKKDLAITGSGGVFVRLAN